MIKPYLTTCISSPDPTGLIHKATDHMLYLYTRVIINYMMNPGGSILVDYEQKSLFADDPVVFYSTSIHEMLEFINKYQ